MAPKTQKQATDGAPGVHAFERFWRRAAVIACSGSRAGLAGLAAIAAIAALGGLAASQPAAAAEVVISTVAGLQVAGDLQAIDDNAVRLGDGSAVAIDQVRSIAFSPGGADSGGQGIETVFLACGSVLGGSGVHLSDDEAIAVQLPGGIAAAFPIDAVRGVRLLPERSDSLFERTLADGGDSGNDRVYVPQETELRELAGVLESLSLEKVTLDRGGVVVELPRSRIYGVLFAAALEADVDGLNALVHTTDGSKLRGSLAGFADGVLRLRMLEDVEVSLPARHLNRIRLQPPNLVYASDLQPESAVVQPLLAPERDWQRDRNVAGGELRLGGRSFEKGIGMAAGTRITFANPGAFATLTALVGIDAERDRRGDCEAIVLADGREVMRQRLRGGEEPVALSLDVAGASRIILGVEAGNDYDLSDHVNWCDAAFLKK